MAGLSVLELEGLIRKTQSEFSHPECATCECYLGFLTQLALDGRKEIRSAVNGFQPPREEVHACLGCDPCPPADAYAEYLKRDQEIVLIEQVMHRHDGEDDGI